ncbi:response regulator [Hugenholtzia roseola]|uniref:response regulator n=1 Tax=Hugenholtzia roseola TaxID=1002 RepID=UPI00040D897A|nr:response regulator [Hugenholtzia roseola]
MNLFKWFSNLNINAKLSFSYFFIVAMVVAMSYVALSDVERLRNRAEQVANKQFAGLKLLTHIAEAYPLTLTRTRDAIFAPQANQRSLFREEIFFLEKQIDTWSRELDSKLETDEERELFERYSKALNTFRKKRGEVLSIDNNSVESEAALTKALYGDLQASSDELKNAIDDLIKKKEEVAEQSQAQNQATVREAYMTLLSLAAITILVIFVMWFVIKGYVSKPIEELEKSAAAVALGDLNVHIKGHRNDEIGKLSQSFNQIVRSLDQIVSQANAISQGDFSTNITPRSEKDQLAIALTRMTSNLRDQNYLKDGLTRLNVLLSGHYSTEELSERIISFLGEFLEVGCGVLYVYYDETRRLHLTSSYAFVERDSLRTSFGIKEGIVGQVAHERKPILLKNAQNETEMRITSGTVERKPTQVLAFPLVYENELCGVIELAAFEPFTALQRTFLEDATETMASHLYSALQESKMKLLFEMAESARKEAEEQAKRVEQANLQLKAEQMRVQQQSEELQQQNEEMQQQAEELQQTNEELQQQQEQLERQRSELEFRNELLVDAQKELETKAEELQRSSKYKSEFLANMSHELRTPLNSIILLSDMLRRNSTKTLSDREVQKCQVIYQSGNDLLNLINDILDISKIEAGRMVVNIFHFQTEELTAQLKALFDEIAKQKGLQFHIVDELQSELVNDRDKLAQVLKNFLSNAFKFTREGSVTLRISHNPDAKTKAKHPIRIGVKDTGIGIPKDKQKIIFEAFQQVDGSVSREFGGTGLGLSIARELTMMLGGELHLESKENEGSEFYILLPLRNEIRNSSIRDRQIEVNYEPKNLTMQAATEVAENAPRQMPMYRGVVKLSIDDDRETITEDDKVILIVEDNIDYANSLAEISRGAGMKALIATSAKEALSDLEQIVPVGILLDLGLPDMNGSELLELIKQKDELRAIPISIVSARDKNLELFEKGAIGYLQKPIEAWQVREEVVRLAGISSKQEKQMLLVEDDPIQQGFLLEMFNKEAVSCKAVTTEDAAKEELSKGAYDAVIADLNLEKGSGMALSRYIREQRMNIPVIIYTSKDLTPEETSELRLYSVSIIIKNPQSHNQLLDKTKMFLHQVSKETPIKSNKKPLFKPKPVVVEPEPLPLPPDPSTQNAPDIQPIQVVNEKLEKLLVNESESSNMLSGKRILIVDDDIRNVFVITSALENHEAEIFEALNGQEALNVLEEEEIDLILMDIMMPIMDGYETIKNIRKDERIKHIPIIAVTAKALKEDRDKCIEAGADDYMTKPIDYNLLLKLVREQLERLQKAKKLR